jgi:hypothetical protein
MRRSNILCKSLSTVESLGAVNIICSDKTGTLTQNKMTAANIAIGPNQYTVAEGREKAAHGGQEGQAVKVLSAVAGLCNDATFESSVSDVPVEVRKVNGDATGESQSFEHLPRANLIWNCNQTLGFFDSRKASLLSKGCVDRGKRLARLHLTRVSFLNLQPANTDV